VVKQLRPTSNNPKHLQLARRLFQSEAETLERLGEHEQIPRLLAYFEEDQEFYLVQEMIEGPSLSTELSVGRHVTEARIGQILRELLEILSFVHSKQVIHRDIKPSNVIKRQADGHLVLIDFGAVKALHHQMSDAETLATVTIGIGTQGYMPPEQCAGNPRFSSDIYAVGMMAIQGLTGLPPSQLQENPQTGEVVWQDRAIVNPSLAAVLSKMVHYDYRAKISNLGTQISAPRAPEPPQSEAKALAPDRGITDEPPTKPWPPVLRAEDSPPTQPPR
jgi:serine/threonine protein kinase